MLISDKIDFKLTLVKDPIGQIDLTDIFKIFYPTTAQYTFFSSAQGTLSKKDHILGHKANLSKYKKIFPPYF
jgi:hypothetical protein